MDLFPTNGGSPSNGTPDPDWWGMPEDMVAISALRGTGLPDLRKLIVDKLSTTAAVA